LAPGFILIVLRQLNEDGEGSHPPLNEATLMTEAGLVIIAGSDTTGTAMANAVVFLIAHPECFTRLRAELDAAAGEGADYDTEIVPDELVELEYLQAIINETLRLMPVFPNGTARMPPPDGGPVMVAGQYVATLSLSHSVLIRRQRRPCRDDRSDPRVVSCVSRPRCVPRHLTSSLVHRDPRYFWPDPASFWPERWLPNEGPKIAQAHGQEFRLDHGAYIPFNYGKSRCVHLSERVQLFAAGPGICVGRSLALNEMRMVLSTFVRRFDVRFAPGFTAADWTSQLRDVGNLARGKLPVILSKRK
jgi:cytochrome P450